MYCRGASVLLERMSNPWCWWLQTLSTLRSFTAGWFSEKVKVKVKFTPEQATKDRKGTRGIAVLFSLTSVLDGGGWSLPRSGRLTLGRETRYLLYRRLGGPQGRPGRVRKISPPTGIRFPDRPARGHSLSRPTHDFVIRWWLCRRHVVAVPVSTANTEKCADRGNERHQRCVCFVPVLSTTAVARYLCLSSYVVSHRTVTTEVRVRSHVSPCEICGR